MDLAALPQHVKDVRLTAVFVSHTGCRINTLLSTQEIKGTATQEFLINLQEDVGAMHTQLRLVQTEFDRRYNDLLSRVSKGADRKKLVEELTLKSVGEPDEAYSKFAKSLHDTWVKRLLSAIADPIIKTIWLYGDGTTGKSYWCDQIAAVTSVVAIFEAQNLFPSCRVVPAGTCRVVIGYSELSGDSHVSLVDVDRSIETTKLDVCCDQTSLARYWKSLLV